MQNIQKPGDAFIGKAYRAESGLAIRGETAEDIVNFEARELGNIDIREQARSLGIDLSSIKERNVVWVTKTPGDGRRYGIPEEYPLPKGSIILSSDGDGGYLVWKRGEQNEV